MGGTIRVVFALCVIALSFACRREESESVVVVGDQADAVWRRAERREPVGDRSVQITEAIDGSQLRTSSQVYRLALPGGTVLGVVSCIGSCKPLIISPSGPTSCGVKSGCDVTSQGGCSPIQCDTGCFPFGCQKISTGFGSRGIIFP
jgi:hypothetical protein